ncbi:stalk domain-containing protein [Crassaminicella indica]|uniref:NPCBM/NEW2 domain-containing protein n=1 Tax=Crassaminicella indica TaxID=2855394 RepID=A0ABX8RCG4_9CLOT|nr:stalk domain-containing protein [Crassaminicella indica]QXM06743.1 NPCBM/NEW2 domain-containing protein [Crassaminicella indica]
MKKVMIGLVLGLLFSFSFVNADAIVKNISVNYGIVKRIIIDGEDNKFSDKKPFVYNGTTYVPLRYISENLGKKVTWDGKTGTVYIGEVPQIQTVSSVDEVYLTDKKISYYSNVYLYRIDNSTSKSLNKDLDAGFDYPKDFIMSLMVDPITEKIEQYKKGMCIRAYDDGARLVYKLDGKYNKLTGLVGLDHVLNEGLDEAYIVSFIVDGDIKQKIEIKKSKYPQHIDIELTNGKELEIEFKRPKGNKSEPFIDLVDMVLE